MTSVKLCIIVFVIGAGAYFADTKNWSDFNPYPDILTISEEICLIYRKYGFKGISNGAAVIFFAYLGYAPHLRCIC